jgi:hypothetical protein
VAAAFGTTTSVVSGGLACITGALILARLLPAFSRQKTSAAGEGLECAPAAVASWPTSRRQLSGS